MSSSKPAGADPATSGRWRDEARSVLSALPRYLGTRVRSTREVEDYLRRRGVPPKQASRAVADCQARGLLDDRACARLWTDHWARSGYATSAIRLKLAAKGLPDAAIDEATRAYAAPVEEEARARLVVSAARRRGARQPGRLMRALAARGFEADVIERVVGETLPS